MKTMRLYALLIFLAVALAFSAGYLSLSIRNAPRAVQGSIGDIVKIKAQFQRENSSEVEISLPDLYPSSGFSQLVDPSYALPQNRRFSFREISKLYRYSHTCSGPIGGRPADPFLKKSWQWQEFKCGKLRELPKNFFETAPFVSALGGSFAFLAARSPDRIQLNRDWIRSHIRFFHVLELPLLEHFQIALEEPRQALLSFEPDSLQAIAEGDELVLGKRWVLFRQPPKTQGITDSSILLGRAQTYSAFRRQDWDIALAKSDYRTDVLRNGQLCALKEGQVCWRLATDEIFRNIQIRTWVLFLFAVAMTGVCVWTAIRKFRLQKLEEERKRFALQTLTHELRTPLASLVVSSEEILDRFDSIPNELQGPMVRMCDDIQRLHRLAEVSKSYLNSEDRDGLIQFQFKKVPSIHSYLQSVLEPFEGKILSTLPVTDQSFTLDPHWVGVCIKNLIENSLQHGQPPVRFSAEVTQGILKITVEDGGMDFSSDLDKMTRPFAKGTSSRGLGLGLAIVRKVVETMGADLSFTPRPTRFSLRIRERESRS